LDKQLLGEINFKKICFDSEQQSSLVMIPSQGLLDCNFCTEQLRALSSQYNVYFLDSKLPKASELEHFAEAVLLELRELGVLRATVLGLGEGGSLAQAMALANKKLVRRLILINATCRLNPSLCSRVIDYLESAFPFGLPLRSLGKDYDSRPFAHRIDCPVLLLSTEGASNYEIRQSQFLAKRLPNAWLLSLVTRGSGSSEGSISSSSNQVNFGPEILKAIAEFSEVSARVPQKSQKPIETTQAQL